MTTTARIVRALVWTAAVLWSLGALGVLAILGEESEAAGGWDMGLEPLDYLLTLLSIPAALGGAWLVARSIAQRTLRGEGRRAWVVPLAIAAAVSVAVWLVAAVVSSAA